MTYQAPALSLLRSRLSQALDSKGFGKEKSQDNLSQRDDIAFLDPFWKTTVVPDLEDIKVPSLPSSPASDISHILWLKDKAIDSGCETTFWNTFWQTLPRSVLLLVRYTDWFSFHYDPPWLSIIRPLLELTTRFSQEELDQQLFGSQLRLLPGNDVIDPTFFPCPDSLVNLAEQIIDIELNDEGTPEFDEWESELMDQGEMNKALESWEKKYEQYCVPRRRAYSRILDQLPERGHSTDFLRSYCYAQLNLNSEIAQFYARRAFQQQPDNGYYAWFLAELIGSTASIRNAAQQAMQEAISLLQQPVCQPLGDTELSLAKMYRSIGHLDTSRCYLLRYHRLWPFLPDVTYELASLAQEQKDEQAYAFWRDKTIRLDGVDGMWSVMVKF